MCIPNSLILTTIALSEPGEQYPPNGGIVRRSALKSDDYKVPKPSNKEISVVFIDDDVDLISQYQHFLERKVNNRNSITDQRLSDLELNFRSAKILKRDLEVVYKNKVVFLIDIDMGEGKEEDGLAIIRELREKFSNAIIIVLTAYPDYKEKAMKLGADGYVLKGSKSLLMIMELIKEYIVFYVKNTNFSKGEFVQQSHAEILQRYKYLKAKQTSLSAITDLVVVKERNSIIIRTQLQKYNQSQETTPEEEWYFFRKLFSAEFTKDDFWTAGNCKWEVGIINDDPLEGLRELDIDEIRLQIQVNRNPGTGYIDSLSIGDIGRIWRLDSLEQIGRSIDLVPQYPEITKGLEVAIGINLAILFNNCQDNSTQKGKIIEVASLLSIEAKIELLKNILHTSYRKHNDLDDAVDSIIPFYDHGNFPLILNIEKGVVERINQAEKIVDVKIGSWLDDTKVKTIRRFNLERLQEHGIKDMHDYFFYIALRNPDQTRTMNVSLADPYM